MMNYGQLCARAEGASWIRSWLYIEQGNLALTEDLIEGLVRGVKVPTKNVAAGRSRDWVKEALIVAPKDFFRELDLKPVDDRIRVFVVRDAQEMFTTAKIDGTLMRLSREMKNPRVRIVLVGDKPSDEAVKFFEAESCYGVVTEPTVEKIGHWMAAKTVPRMKYTNTEIGGRITPEVGLMLAEWVGWDFTAMLQAARTLYVYGEEEYDWDAVSAIVPPKVGFGYAESLVFAKGRRMALTLAQGIPEEEVRRTLGLIRFYLRQFHKLRAVRAETLSDRAIPEETGIHIWHWKTRYKNVYPSYTVDRLRMRQERVEEAMRSADKAGVLEVLALEW